MIDPAGRLHRPATADQVVSVASRSQAPQSQLFAAELSDKLASTTNNASRAAELPRSLPAGQQVVTWRDPGPIIAPVSTSVSAAGSPPSGLNGLVITYPPGTTSGTTSGATSGASSGPAASAGTPAAQPESFDEAYWASQPAAVQQLQNIQNPAERAQVATQLAQEGYSIDVPIMVWGWDPATTTAARESMGYTWVPSAGQQPVGVAPGVTFAGTAYNPSAPPAGSITV